MVGKYVGLLDSYLSISKALEHAGNHSDRHVRIEWIEAENIQEDKKETELYQSKWEIIKKANGIIVPGGFGPRGVAGKLNVINYAWTNKVPYFGICYGM